MKRNAALLTENRQQMWRKETRKEETKIPGRRWEQRTVRAFESTDAIACADTDPPCYCTILPTPAALPFASPNTAKPPFCPHTLTLSQTQSFPVAAAHRSQAYTGLLCSAKCFARSAQNTRPRPRIVVVSDSAGMIRVSFLRSFLAWQQFLFFYFKNILGGLFLGIIRSLPFVLFEISISEKKIRCRFKFGKKKSPKFEKKRKKKNPYKFPQISIMVQVWSRKYGRMFFLKCFFFPTCSIAKFG